MGDLEDIAAELKMWKAEVGGDAIECIERLAELGCPGDIIASLKQWEREPIPDLHKLKQWEALCEKGD